MPRVATMATAISGANAHLLESQLRAVQRLPAEVSEQNCTYRPASSDSSLTIPDLLNRVDHQRPTRLGAQGTDTPTTELRLGGSYDKKRRRALEALRNTPVRTLSPKNPRKLLVQD